MNNIVSFTSVHLPCCRPGDGQMDGTTWAPTVKKASAMIFVIPFSLSLRSLCLLLLSLSLLCWLSLLLRLLLLLRLRWLLG